MYPQTNSAQALVAIMILLKDDTHFAVFGCEKTWLETLIYGRMKTLRKRNLCKYGPNDLLLSTNTHYDRGCAYHSRIRAFFLWVKYSVGVKIFGDETTSLPHIPNLAYTSK